MDKAVNDILLENARRVTEIHAKFDPITGENSVGRRVKVHIDGFPLRDQWIPVTMMENPLVRRIVDLGSVDAFLDDEQSDPEDREEDRDKVINKLIRIRCRHDFPFWAAFLVSISNKEGGPDITFTLTRPQRRLVATLEEMRLADIPIRLVLLKARQWGGSTTIQMYMAWLQLVHKVGLNSAIVAHQSSGSDRIKEMYSRMLAEYPTEMLHPMGEPFAPNEPKWRRVGDSGSIFKVPQRNCEISLGTAERPDSCRSGAYSLVHFSEAAIWKKTEGKTPEQIVQAVSSGVLYTPMTMIVYESTANGTGNFFHREYIDAKAGRSQFRSLFISWFDIDLYSLAIPNPEAFARGLWENRDNGNEASDRDESGKYLWWLWGRGATLEAIYWYVQERKKYTSHDLMASEYPSDDIEAFCNTGARVFDRYAVEAFRPSCRRPTWVGEVYGDRTEGEEALQNLRFVEDRNGCLSVWELPEADTETDYISNRYLVSVDVGGRGSKADWSVITVFDRLFMIDGGPPAVVAQWYGHTDIDILAWKAAQIAAFYNNALLVIESNTIETRESNNEGDQSEFILNLIADVYDNLYAREQPAEDIIAGIPKHYGFHTNTKTKPAIISSLVKIIREHLYIERDEGALHEYLCYEKRQNNSYGAIEGEHDDKLMARAIGLYICYYKMDPPRIVERAAMRTRKRRVVSAATM